MGRTVGSGAGNHHFALANPFLFFPLTLSDKGEEHVTINVPTIDLPLLVDPALVLLDKLHLGQLCDLRHPGSPRLWLAQVAGKPHSIRETETQVGFAYLGGNSQVAVFTHAEVFSIVPPGGVATRVDHITQNRIALNGLPQAAARLRHEQ